MNERYDKDEIKRRLSFLDLVAHEGIAVRRAGGLWLARCPFHEEKSGSFTIYNEADHTGDHAHCFGCGWNGDIFKFWMARHGGGFLDSLQPLASLASVSPGVFEAKRSAASQVTPVSAAARKLREKPALPRMRGLSDVEVQTLSTLRKLSSSGVAAAARRKRVGFCEWPQFIDRDGCWRVAKDAVASWVVTDAARSVAQFRRLDGGLYLRKDGQSIKAWTKGSPTWPLGASEMGESVAVLMIEGGADMLAAYHFLDLFGRLDQVAVTAMLGASCAICEEALPYFGGKRVRIIMDNDEPNKKTGLIPSFEAAARWTHQLNAVGAVVESFSLDGLLKRDGSRVKDLNDLTEVDEAAWLDPELRAAFFDFDF